MGENCPDHPSRADSYSLSSMQQLTLNVFVSLICCTSILSAVRYVYHLSFPRFCDGPYGIVQYSYHVLWQL